jgi:hypothetical protein
MPLITPLSNRIGGLPLILCGPIIRRVEPGLVTIWVALKQEQDIKLELYTGYRKPTTPEDTGRTVAFSSPMTKTIRLGEHLHIGLVTIETNGQFTPNTIFSYNLFFSGNNATANLISLNLLKAPVQLGFEENQLPSFVMAPLQLESLRISHGSCRKPHGRGRDGLAMLAKVMESDFSKPVPTIRPHYLFHTGDQIYADDVSGFLMHSIMDAGNTLLGCVEALPFPKLTPATPDKRFPDLAGNLANEINWMDATAENWPPMRRATNYYTAFSGDEANHLTSFGEFCAAYLFQWCDVLWPADLPDPAELFETKLNGHVPASEPYLLPFPSDTDFTLFPVVSDAEFAKLSAAEKTAYTFKVETLGPDEETAYNIKKEAVEKERTKFIDGAAKPESSRQNIKEFKAGLPLVRRTLANVPSIMIFDDHDVTDDWYLTGGWAKGALGNPLGQTIIRNGLMAFSFFQASGNNPKAYKTPDSPEDKLQKGFLQILAKYKKNTLGAIPLTNDKLLEIHTDALKINTMLGFNNFDNPPVKWHCSLRVGPAKVYVLDTRTRRDFSDGLNYPPNLIKANALAEQIPDTSLPVGVELAIVVSAAPVLGLAAIEVIGQPIVSRVLDCVRIVQEPPKPKTREVSHKGHESLDVEAWGIHQRGFEALLKRCAPLKKVMFLSGDVHYGITTQMDYFIKGQTEASRFVQMVSSSLKNIKPEGHLMGLLPSSVAQTALAGGLNREMAEMRLLAWDNAADIAKLKFRFQTEPGKYRDSKAGEFPLRYTYALKQKTVMLTLRDWPMTAFQPVGSDGKPTGNEVIHERIVFPKDVPEPAYRWRLTVVPDERPDNIRLGSLPDGQLDPTTDLPTDIKDAKYQDGINTILNRNAFFSRTHISRFVNWYSHIAIISFKKTDNQFKSVNAMFFHPDNLPEAFDPATNKLELKPGSFEKPFIQQEVALTAAPASEKPLIPIEKTSGSN